MGPIQAPAWRNGMGEKYPNRLIPERREFQKMDKKGGSM